MRTYIWSVKGMHCASCERLIAQELKKIPGVTEVEVSLRKNKAGLRIVEQVAEPDLNAINRALQQHGYVLFDCKTKPAEVACRVEPKHSLGRRLLEAAGMFLLVFAAGSLIIRPLLRFIPALTAQTSLLALFGFGIVASLSSCLASTGGFLLAYTAEETPTKKKIFWIHVGRLVAFIVGGALLGGLGGLLPSAGIFPGWVALILGLGFLIVGLHLLQISPSLASVGVRLPGKFNHWADRITKSQSRFAPFLVGAVTFVLPCGFTQTAQALALASGSVVRGAFMMGAFALGTLPVLVGVTSFGSFAALRHRFVRLATGAILVLFAVGQIDGGLTVLGSSVTVEGAISGVFSGLSRSVEPTPVLAGEQVVQMTVAYGAFSPNRFTIKKGIPVRWEINGVDVSGCASSIVSPKLRVYQALSRGLNVIRFTPKSAGAIPFSCGMGMIRGSFNVVN